MYLGKYKFTWNTYYPNKIDLEYDIVAHFQYFWKLLKQKPAKDKCMFYNTCSQE